MGARSGGEGALLLLGDNSVRCCWWVPAAARSGSLSLTSSMSLSWSVSADKSTTGVCRFFLPASVFTKYLSLCLDLLWGCGATGRLEREKRESGRLEQEASTGSTDIARGRGGLVCGISCSESEEGDPEELEGGGEDSCSFCFCRILVMVLAEFCTMRTELLDWAFFAFLA